MNPSNKNTVRRIEVILILMVVVSGISLNQLAKYLAVKWGNEHFPKEDIFKNHPLYNAQNLEIEHLQTKVNENKAAIRARERLLIEIELGLELKDHGLTKQMEALNGKSAPKLALAEESRTLQSQFEKRNNEIKYLQSRLSKLDQRLSRLNVVKSDSLKASKARFTAATGCHEVLISSGAAMGAAIFIALLLLIVHWFLRLKQGIKVFKWRSRLITTASACLLALIISYEILGLYAPLVLCLVVLTICIGLILQKDIQKS